MQRYLLCCGYTGSSLEVKIETDSNDAVEIKTEADSNDITEYHTDDMPHTAMFGLYCVLQIFVHLFVSIRHKWY